MTGTFFGGDASIGGCGRGKKRGKEVISGGSPERLGTQCQVDGEGRACLEKEEAMKTWMGMDR